MPDDPTFITVKELIDILLEEDQSRIVVMSRDGEGNGYSPLAAVETAAYEWDRPWCGEIGIERSEELPDGYCEEDYAPEDAVPCVVLWPVN